jgi:hypothetical protein
VLTASIVWQIAVCTSEVALGGLVVIVIAIGHKVHGLKPDRGQWNFKGDKNPQHAFLRRRNKAIGAMS